MKQKNLILMVVAVGCGLLAAFLTSQMSAKPAAQQQLVEVWVVAKELPPGTKFTADSIKDQLKKKSINAEAIPEKAVITEDMLDGKTLNKTLRADEFIRESDLGNYTPLLPPEGKHVATVRMSSDKMTPFLQPNSRVDIVATFTSKETNRVRSSILIPNVLVMAVDARHTLPSGGAQGEMNSQMATVAVSRDEVQAIRLAEHAGVKLSFILRSEQGAGSVEGKVEDWNLAKVEQWINDDNAQTRATPEKPSEAKPDETKPAEVTVKMTVPITDLPAGTELTNDVVQSKFKEVPVIGTAPPNAVLNIKDHVGRFLVKDVAAEQFVPKGYIKDQMPQVAAAPADPRKSGDVAPTPQVKPEVPKDEPVKKLPTFDRTYVTPNGTRVVRYEIQENGELKLIGDVTGQGTEKKDDTAPKKES